MAKKRKRVVVHSGFFGGKHATATHSPSWGRHLMASFFGTKARRRRRKKG